MQSSPTTAARRRLSVLTSMALAGASVLVAIVAAAAPADAAYPGLNGRIAFVRDGNIFTIDPAAHPAQPHQLTTGGRDSGPRWSPDGKHIAYLDDGNLWIMNANGSHQRRITHAAPRYRDSRPSWSPNGKYLAFVKTQRGHRAGILTRYTFSGRSFQTFTTTVNGKLISVTALPAPVAWTWTQSTPKSAADGSFIAVEGAARLCPFAHEYCLDLLGFGTQAAYKNGFPSAEYAPSTFRLTDSDWFPEHPIRDTDVLTTREHCPGGHCQPVGLDLEIGASPVLPGAYEGVYSPDGFSIAYVLNSGGHAGIYVRLVDAILSRRQPPQLTAGTEPDWQPRPIVAARRNGS